MTLGLIGGIVLLLVGIIVSVIGGAIGGASYGLGASSAAAKGGMIVVVALGLPIMAIVGAALSFANPKLAAILMAVPGALTAFVGTTGSEPSLVVIGLGGVLLFAAYCTFTAAPKTDATLTTRSDT